MRSPIEWTFTTRRQVPTRHDVNAAPGEEPLRARPCQCPNDETRLTVALLGVDVDCVDFDQAADRIMVRLDRRQGGWVCTLNVAILMSLHHMVALKRFVDDAAIVVADGAPLVWFSRLKGRPLPERVAGVDLVESLLGRCELEQRSVYFLGSTDQVMDMFVSWCTQKFPRLVIAGHANGYFDEAEADRRAAAVGESGADLLLVGMGVPRQERFVLDHAGSFPGVVAIGVGGSFDVLSGARRRAPVWMQTLGLEWLFRLMQEPRRLWRRYLVTNCRFVVIAARDLFRR